MYRITCIRLCSVSINLLIKDKKKKKDISGVEDSALLHIHIIVTEGCKQFITINATGLLNNRKEIPAVPESEIGLEILFFFLLCSVIVIYSKYFERLLRTGLVEVTKYKTVFHKTNEKVPLFRG